jgi:type I restriction enzyme S subunit
MIYPGCSLGKILKLERRPVEIVPDKKYAEIGIYCFGKGIFHKEPRSGLEVGDKKLFQIKEGDLILQVTFAWEGAVGLASKKEDGNAASWPASRSSPPGSRRRGSCEGGRWKNLG